MQARGLGPDHREKEATIVPGQIVIAIKDFRCRLYRGQPVQGVLLG